MDRPPLRVIALIPGDDFTGPSGQVVSTALDLSGSGVQVIPVLLARPGAVRGRLPEYLQHHGLAFEVVADHGPTDLALPVRVNRLLRQLGPALVETHGYKATAVAFNLRLRRPAWRWIGYFHGLTFESRRARLYHWLDRLMLASADRVVAISEAQRRGPLRHLKHVAVVPSAVPRLLPGQPLPPATVASIRNLPRPLIAFVGRLSPEKGADILLRAVHSLHGRGATHSVVFAGDGPERSTLLDLAAQLGLREQALFLGQVADIAAVYALADLVAIPSRSEGLPSVILEALDADLPVVATNVGAMPEVLATPGAGFLVEPESLDALADALARAVPALLDERSVIARRDTVARFSQTRRAESLLAIYRDLTPARQWQ